METPRGELKVKILVRLSQPLLFQRVIAMGVPQDQALRLPAYQHRLNFLHARSPIKEIQTGTNRRQL
jgi:hypothetical protein